MVIKDDFIFDDAKTDIKETLKELSAELYCIKVAAQYVEDKDTIDKALFAVIRKIDELSEEAG